MKGLNMNFIFVFYSVDTFILFISFNYSISYIDIRYNYKFGLFVFLFPSIHIPGIEFSIKCSNSSSVNYLKCYILYYTFAV